MKNKKKTDERFISVGNTPLGKNENTIQPGAQRLARTITASGDPTGWHQPQLANPERVRKILARAEARGIRRKARIIIGTDDRKPVLSIVYPYKTICCLNISAANGARFQGTGFFIDKRCVITAGHCVYQDKQWMQSVEVIPGYLKGNMNFGKAIAKVFRSVAGWTNDQDSNMDYGAIILGDDSLFNRMQAVLPYDLQNGDELVEIAGYPSDHGSDPYTCSGIIKDRSKYKFFYEVDTERGNSGSPIMISKNGKPLVIGVHTDGDNRNYGIRLRPEVIARWQEWSKL